MNRAQAVRARASARRGPNRLPRGYAGTLLAMFYGLAIAVLVVGAGVGALVTEGIKAGAATAGSGADAKQGEQRPAASPAASPAQISITATHLGELRVGIEARVTMNAQKRPLGEAKVEASLDMTEMPGSHALGPLTLRPAKQPGVYTTVATVPMLGEYEIRVQMHEPVHAEARKVVSVGVVGPGG